MDAINSKSNIRNITNIQKLKILIKKELWEHSFGLFKAPIAFVIFSLVMYFLLFLSSSDVAAVFHYASSSLIITFFMCLMISYFLHCYYDDKKNGSLSFFRSMPYSDTLDLTAKLVVGLVIIPITFYLYFEILWLLQSVVFSFIVPSYKVSSYYGINIFIYILGVLYFTPVLGYFLFVSTFSKRSPYLFALVPVFISLISTLFVSSKAYLLWQVILFPIKKGLNLLFYHIKNTNVSDVFKEAVSSASFWYCIGVFIIFIALALVIRKKSDV
tara:strand:+ start:7476 stop:8288 length:813 start_codon:yes stop_codon:yes gene_type:complete